MKLSRKYVDAFKDELNWLGSGAAIAACFFAGLPVLVPFAWAAYEAAYLLFVPDSKWYEQRLGRKALAEVARQQRIVKKRLLPSLLEEDRRRFTELEQLRAEIAAQQSGSAALQAEILGKLDFLLERFLLFGSKRGQYAGYLRALAARLRNAAQTGDRPEIWIPFGIARPRPAAHEEPDDLLPGVLQAYDRRLLEIERELQREPDPRTRAILEKDREVLSQLRANTAQIGQITRNIEQQMHLVADTFALINGQIRTAAPEQMVADVDDVIGSSQALTDAITEVAPAEQALQRLGQTSTRG